MEFGYSYLFNTMKKILKSLNYANKNSIPSVTSDWSKGVKTILNSSQVASEVVLIKSTINPEGNFPSNRGLYRGECGSFGAGGSGSKRPSKTKYLISKGTLKSNLLLKLNKWHFVSNIVLAHWDKKNVWVIEKNFLKF